MSGLRTRQLTKVYGATQALCGIDLDVPEGAVYGLVGPNGSGKTTTLELLAGLRRPTAGTIDLGVDQTFVAYCPDAAEFEPWLTAREVLAVAAGLLGHSPARTSLDGTLDRVGLSDAADRRVGGFSRGMFSRLNLAAGLVSEPKILIADEPAAALDPAGRWEVIDLLADLAGSVTVIVSSHDLAEVQRICTGIGVLARGRLVYQGEVAALLDKAGSTFRLVVHPPTDRLRGALAALSWVRSVREDGPGELVIDVSDRELAEQRLPVVLAETNARLIEFGRAGINLEDIFFELTESGPYRRHPGTFP